MLGGENSAGGKHGNWQQHNNPPNDNGNNSQMFSGKKGPGDAGTTKNGPGGKNGAAPGFSAGGPEDGNGL